MQNRLKRLQSGVLPVTSRVVGGVVMLLVAALSFMAFHSAPRAYAAGPSFKMITGTISSSPSSGPTGTVIAVSGSGWGGTNGTSVYFGYQVKSSCQIVADAQDGNLKGGSFSGWFRWPSGTALSTFSVCAMLGSVMEVADSFTVKSSAPPGVTISPSTLKPNTQATITANNYYPSNTQVNFLWMSGNTVVDNLHSAVSNTSGVAVLTFTVPKLSVANGQYSISATAGGGQPPTLQSSTNFTYNGPVASPSPTVTPSPTPSPTVTVTPGITPTTTPTVGASSTVGGSQTPTSNGPSSRSNVSNTGNSTPGALVIGGVAIVLGVLLAGVVAVLLLRRRRTAARVTTKVVPQGPPGSPNPASFPSYGPVPAPGIFAPQPDNMPASPNTPPPVPVAAGALAGNGNGYVTAPAGDPRATGPATLPPLPSAWLSSSIPDVNAPAGNGNPAVAAPADPTLDAMRRQAQAGLFVQPRPFKDERSQ